MIRRVALIALLALLFAAAGFAAGQQEGKVTIMYMTEEGDPPSVAVYNEFKADFEAENPNITVQIQQIESGTLSRPKIWPGH